MAQTKIAKNVLPEEISRAVLAKAKSIFVSEYHETLLLLIRISDGFDELADGLAAAAASGRGPALKPIPNIDFHTEIFDSKALLAAVRARNLGDDRRERTIEEVLSQFPHFVVPLHKRAEADQLSAERISVGRARNKDVVLRHPSVSKFHGWFHLDEEGAFSLADAGSKNGTRLNDRLLLPRKFSRVEPGDRISFGSVEAIVSTAEMLWNAVHGRAPER